MNCNPRLEVEPFRKWLRLLKRVMSPLKAVCLSFSISWSIWFMTLLRMS